MRRLHRAPVSAVGTVSPDCFTSPLMIAESITCVSHTDDSFDGALLGD